MKSTYFYHDAYDKNNGYGDTYYYDLDLYSPLKIQHIMCLLFYTNFTELSYNFSKSFRRITKSELDTEVKSRNSLWYHMSRNL